VARISNSINAKVALKILIIKQPLCLVNNKFKVKMLAVEESAMQNLSSPVNLVLISFHLAQTLEI
jgi:hypothetical protein